MNAAPPDPRRGACEGCALEPERRIFLQRLGGTVMSALVMLGMPPGVAALMEPRAVAPNRKVGASPTYPVPAADGVEIDHANQVILVRWLDHIYAFNLSCPHQNAALRWNGMDEQFQCPKHHSKYRPDGTFVSGRATRNMDRFNLSRLGNEIVVDVNHMHKDDNEPSAWAAAVVVVGTG